MEPHDPTDEAFLAIQQALGTALTANDRTTFEQVLLENIRLVALCVHPYPTGRAEPAMSANWPVAAPSAPTRQPSTRAAYMAGRLL
jgi:hypothetical protein